MGNEAKEKGKVKEKSWNNKSDLESSEEEIVIVEHMAQLVRWNL